MFLGGGNVAIIERWRQRGGAIFLGLTNPNRSPAAIPAFVFCGAVIFRATGPALSSPASMRSPASFGSALVAWHVCDPAEAARAARIHAVLMPEIGQHHRVGYVTGIRVDQAKLER